MALLAFAIGLAQMLALVPGVSRSGATIMGGELLGVSRTGLAWDWSGRKELVPPA